MQYQGRTAVVTGASSGIGEEFARALAAQGANVVLIARREEKLKRLADELAELHGVDAATVVADLATPEGMVRATDALRKPVDVLVNNAGFATYGRFDELDLRRMIEEVNLNVAAVVALSHHAAIQMAARGSGAIVNVASTAAYLPVPYMAVYAATKAFVLSFSQALWAEYRHRGVRVLAVCPGATETPFFEVVGSDDAAVGRRMRPEVVVNRALAALRGRRPVVTTGVGNVLMTALPARVLPRSAVASLSERTMRPKSEVR